MAGNMKIGITGRPLDDNGVRLRPPEDIDAHDKKAGDFTQQVSVGGKTVYLTKEGEAAYLRAQSQSFRFTVDSEWIAREQAYSGKTK